MRRIRLSSLFVIPLLIVALATPPVKAQIDWPGSVDTMDFCCFWKDRFCDYAPKGMPDFDQKKDGWECPPGQFSWCGPAAAANCIWWFDSKYDYLNDLAELPFDCISPPNINDYYSLIGPYGAWDDHDPQNVDTFISWMGYYLDTDGNVSGGSHCGTILPDMVSGLDSYIEGRAPQGDEFCVTQLDNPCWETLERWLRCSEDVILLLGFYWQDPGGGEWFRSGGHYVTAAGFCDDLGDDVIEICISDPYYDRFESPGHPRGRIGSGVMIPHSPLPHTDPYIHDDAGNNSHDCYPLQVGTFPDDACLALPTYAADCSDIDNFDGMNPQSAGEFLLPCGVGMPLMTVIDAAVRISPRSVRTDLTIRETTAQTKSMLSFDVTYTNCWCDYMGDDETVTPQLHTLLYNGKMAGEYSSLLDPIPTLGPGQVWNDSGFTVTVPKTSIKKIQKILNSNIRARTQTLIDGVVDHNSRDWAPFKITEYGSETPFRVLVSPSDENQDPQESNGFGGIDPAEGEADGTNNTGNEGFWSIHVPHLAGDMIGTRLHVPWVPDVDWTLYRFDFSAADFASVYPPSSLVGLYYSDSLGNLDPTNPVLAAQVHTPPVANSTTGGDHWNSINIPATTVHEGEVLHLVYFFGSGRNEGLGIDSMWGKKGEVLAVQYERTYFSLDGDFIEDCPWPGNWIARLHLEQQTPLPSPTPEPDHDAFESWQAMILKGWNAL